MAKAKQEKTAAMLKMEQTAERLKHAKDVFEKQDNAKNKQAVTEASEAHKAATKAVNRERFINVGNSRAGKALSTIELCGNIANKRSYEFSEEEANLFIKSLRDAVNVLDGKFKAALAGGDKATKQTKAALFS